MQWLLLGIVAVALLFLSGRYPRAAFGILAVLAVGAALVLFTTQESAQVARHKLPSDDIRIENAVMTRAYGDSYQFSARLINANERIELKEAAISITMLDCPDDDPQHHCTVIGQTQERINVRIPPGQSRDVSRNVFFHGAAPIGIVRWRHRVTETRS